MKPRAQPADISRIKTVLREGNWIKGRDLARMANVPRRLIRAAAEETGEIISSQQGYKLAVKASADELVQAQNDLLSRSAHLRSRANRLGMMLRHRVLDQPI